MAGYIIHNAEIVNKGEITTGSLLIENEIIKKIFTSDVPETLLEQYQVILAEGKYLIPGVIDDQVHFREPGLTYKADIYTESKAAIAGGITSFMEMPNTNPQTTSQKELDAKFKLGAEKSLANYSFYIGATNDNIDELLATDIRNVCGMKVFMGSSTGNMLVDNRETLSKLFSKSRLLIATHCEDTPTIVNNTNIYKEKYGEEIPFRYHADIRSEEACYLSTSMAVELAKKHDTRLHVLHLSTAKELKLFSNQIDRKDKNITAEVCVHHLWFNKDDYETYGPRIKWNPSIKEAHHQEALFRALLDGTLDVVATDHAPHTLEEKSGNYFNAMSGGPLVQHALPTMLEFCHKGKMNIETVVDKMCHAPADIYKVENRGYIKEGFQADLALIDMHNSWTVSKENILYKCGWSPFERQLFKSKVTHTFVNGHLAYENGNFNESLKGQALKFNR